MARRGENIRKRKDGRWEGRYPKGKRNGKYIQGSVFGKTYQEAKDKLVAAKVEHAKSTEIRTVQHGKDPNLSFRSAAEAWLEKKRTTLKDSTLARYRTALDCHLLPFFGDSTVIAISRDEVMAFSNLLMGKEDDGKGLAPKTVSSILSVMKNVMNYARIDLELNVVSFDGLSVKIPKKQLRIFSLFEQGVLNTYLLENLTPINLGILLCLYTGLRIGELCALKWGDISFNEKKLRVERTMQRVQKPDDNGHKTQVVITPPKSDCSIRDIPLPDEIIQILTKKRQSGGCFFLTGKENKYIEPRTMENHFNKVMSACGIKGATFHCCRRTFATRSVELGFDIKSLSEILGHANVSITMNRYVHPSMEYKRQNMDKLCDLLRVKNRVNADLQSA